MMSPSRVHFIESLRNFNLHFELLALAYGQVDMKYCPTILVPSYLPSYEGTIIYLLIGL